MENKSLNFSKAGTKYSCLSSCLRNIFCLLLLFCAIPQLYAKPEKAIVSEQQQSKIKVSGSIVDEKGEPVIGASVIEEGTSNGTVADLEGKFNLTLSPNATLQVSYLGYNTQKIQVKGKTLFSITMKEDSKSLDEVVVVGYGTQRVKDVTGAVTAVKMNDISELAGASLIDGLKGQVVGLSVTQSSGRPGATGSFKIRESFSWGEGSTGSSPLIVIDDIIQVDQYGAPSSASFNMLDHSEVESITVLKDASAAIYGSRASQGVIVVKTKRGKIGAPKISYSGKLDFSDAVSHRKVMNAYETGLYTNRILRATGSEAQLMYSDQELEAMKSLNYDWLDKAWSSSVSQRHSVDVSGGSDRATYFAGISYMDQNSNLGDQDYKRWTFRSGTDINITKSLKLSAILSANNSKQIKPFSKLNNINDSSWGKAANGDSETGDYGLLLHMPKSIPWSVNVPGYDGEQWVSPVTGPHTDPISPNVVGKIAGWNYFGIQDNGSKSINDGNNYAANFSMEYEVPYVKGLSVRATYAVNYSNSYTEQMQLPYNLARALNTKDVDKHLISENTEWSLITNIQNSQVNYIKSTTKSQQMNLYLNYKRSFGLHNISALGSIERGEAENNTSSLKYEKPILDAYNGASSSAGTLNSNSGLTKGESGSLSYIGRVNYNYNSRYLAEFLFRTDASTKFAPENYWGFFPSLSLGWVISEEKWFNKDGFVNYLKLRGSLGKTGKDNVKAWSWLQFYGWMADKGLSFGDGGGNKTNALQASKSPNRLLKWDKTLKRNIGVDLNVLDNRLSVSSDFWYDTSTDLIMLKDAMNVPISWGGSIAPLNYGEAKAWGSEISVRWNDHFGPVKYSIGMDYGISWTKIKQGAEAVFNYPSEMNQGQTVGTVTPYNTYGLKVWRGTSTGDGILRTQADIDNYWNYLTELAGTDNTVSYLGITQKDKIRPGMLAYQDIAGEVDTDGKTIAGPNGRIVQDQDYAKLKSDRTHNINTKLNFSYKSFSFSTLIMTSWGGYSAMDYINQPINSDAMIWSQPIYLTDMFDATDNPNGRYPILAGNSKTDNYYAVNGIPSDFWQVSSFRCYISNMTFGYGLPKHIIRKVGIDNARILLTGNNLWDFYNPYPKKYRNMYDDATSAYPTLRTWTLGVNLTF